jgi:uncharacterized protein YicC (UPF0701 family)
MSPAKNTKKPMSAEHKAALAQGRVEGRAVRNYLEALQKHRPRRGRKRTEGTVKNRLAKIEEMLPDADPVRRVDLIQERMDLRNELENLEKKVDLDGLENEFVKAAKGYSERKGISYAAWRESGVSPAVLKAAGIGRGS